MTAAAPTDEIYDRYLKKAISEVNELQHELLEIADESHVPVLGSGHPLADIFLLKHSPQQAEIILNVTNADLAATSRAADFSSAASDQAISGGAGR